MKEFYDKLEFDESQNEFSLEIESGEIMASGEITASSVGASSGVSVGAAAGGNSVGSGEEGSTADSVGPAAATCVISGVSGSDTVDAAEVTGASPEGATSVSGGVTACVIVAP